MKEYFEIGQIVNVVGLNGFLKINPFTDDITRFEKLKTIYISVKSNLVEFEIEEVKYNKNLVLLKLKGIDSIEEAEKYKNCYLKIHKDNAIKPKKDSYFIADIIGCIVYTEEDDLVGEVIDVFSTKSNDIYVIKNELGKQILLPAIKSVILEVDIDNKKIIINLIEGLT